MTERGAGSATLNKPVIVALDFPEPAPLFSLLDELNPADCRVKVGKELFTACGPDLVRKITERGFDVFLDLKFHDIPNTVAGAVRAAAKLGAWMLNVHASGGPAMLRAAREALEDGSGGAKRPLLTGVTVLTSLNESDLLALKRTDLHVLRDTDLQIIEGIDRLGKPEEDLKAAEDTIRLALQKVGLSLINLQVLQLAMLCREAGLDGVVCSAAETKLLRAVMPDSFHLVTPGIRRPQDQGDDQKRIIGPAEAVANGSTYLVVGRPITRAPSPAEALAEFNAAVSLATPAGPANPREK